ncbi:MAG: hypothetical protein WBR21_11440, partial [Rouxiella badensis]|uniref:hypothetical protein n=1 Tax=Rouxiella badensis TaxID=1646377 RepID=UPI003C6784C1
IPLIVGAQNPTMISLLTRRKFGIYELAQKPEAFVIAVIYTGLLLAILVVLLRKTEPQIL